MWPAWVDMRSVVPMHAAGRIICPDPTGRSVSCPSDIQSDKTLDKGERAAALLEVDGSEQNTASVPTPKMLPINPCVTHVA